MTTSKKSGTPRKGSKKLNIKKETLKDLEPKRGKDAKGGFIVIPTFNAATCAKTCAITCGDCRTMKCATKVCTYVAPC